VVLTRKRVLGTPSRVVPRHSYSAFAVACDRFEGPMNVINHSNI